MYKRLMYTCQGCRQTVCTDHDLYADWYYCINCFNEMLDESDTLEQEEIGK